MTEPFNACNGIEITMDPDREGKVYLVGRRARGDEGQYLDTHATAGPEGIVALREFFQHERDEELGRWRDPDNPRLTVYPTEGYETDEITILDDVDAETYAITRARAERSQGGWWHDTAKAYFEAHPERKPWEDAKDGEIWEFILGCSSGQYLADGGRFFLLPLRAPSDPGWKPASFASNFETGERIWPEDAS